MTIEIFSYLKRSNICRTLADSEIKEIESFFEKQEVPEGQVIFQKGDIADALYVIGKGVVEIRLLQGSSEEMILQLSDCDVLGEVGLLTDHIRQGTAVSLTPLTLLKLPRMTFEKLLSDNRWPIYKLVYQVAKILSWRLRKMDDAMGRLIEDKNKTDLNQLRAKLQTEWPF